MKQGENTTGTGGADMKRRSDNFVVVTHLVSPLERQLLEHRILLANTVAGTQDPADTARDFRKLRLLESLVNAEKTQNPHYAVTELRDLEEETEADEEAEAETGNSGPGQPPGLASRLMHFCGLDALAEAPWGDLSEERREMAAEAGEFVAGRWFYRQVLVSILPMLPKITRTLFKSLVVSIVALSSRAAGDAMVAWAEELFRRLSH